MATMIETLERQELIQKLIDNGYQELVESILGNETKVFTRRGRSNKSGMCRVLGWKAKKLEDAFMECRRILGDDAL